MMEEIRFFHPSPMQTVRETFNDGHMPENAPKQGSAAFLAVIVALALTIASVVFFKVANASLDRSIARANQEIADIDVSVKTLENDHDIRAYNYYKNAREEVDKSIKLSMAQNYITEFMRVSEKYGVDFTGFSFAEGKITTSAQSQDRGEVKFDAVEKISDMIADYRTRKDDSLFLLDPVMSVQGDEDLRSFAVTFQIDQDAVLKAQSSTGSALAPRRTVASGSGSDALSASGSEVGSGASAESR
jgi:hypothetical protein